MCVFCIFISSFVKFEGINMHMPVYLILHGCVCLVLWDWQSVFQIWNFCLNVWQWWIVCLVNVSVTKECGSVISMLVCHLRESFIQIKGVSKNEGDIPIWGWHQRCPCDFLKWPNPDVASREWDLKWSFEQRQSGRPRQHTVWLAVLRQIQVGQQMVDTALHPSIVATRNGPCDHG